jgi:hypothetical protein
LVKKLLFLFVTAQLREFERQFFSLLSDKGIEVHELLFQCRGSLIHHMAHLLLAWLLASDLGEFELESA